MFSLSGEANSTVMALALHGIQQEYVFSPFSCFSTLESNIMQEDNDFYAYCIQVFNFGYVA